MTEVEIAKGLSEAQRRMVLGSEPGGWGRDDCACGVELTTGAHYAVARALRRKGLGDHDGPGGFLPGLYFNNDSGLRVRTILQENSNGPA